MSKRSKIVASKVKEPSLTSNISTVFKPTTLLGKRLMKIRKKIVASGEPLLGWADIERELAARRGEIYN